LSKGQHEVVPHSRSAHTELMSETRSPLFPLLLVGFRFIAPHSSRPFSSVRFR
jgi:hypothetical protein